MMKRIAMLMGGQFSVVELPLLKHPLLVKLPLQMMVSL